MSFDFKKEYKEFYLPKKKPTIVKVPKMNYLAVRGQGDPNDPEGEYIKSIQLLYGVIDQIIKLKDFLNMLYRH